VDILGYIAIIVVAYGIGSIPTGFWVGLCCGKDIRKEGSGNIGATNAFRVLGKPLGTFVLLVDGAKGYAGAALGAWIYWSYFQNNTAAAEELYSKIPILISGISAILGHNFSFWMRFKGGKGIATTAGVLIAWAPWTFLVVISLWIITAFVTRYSSVSSIVAALSLPFAAWYFQRDIPLTVVSFLVSTMAILKHRSNIKRLLRGEENRIGAKKKSKKSASESTQS